MQAGAQKRGRRCRCGFGRCQASEGIALSSSIERTEDQKLGDPAASGWEELEPGKGTGKEQQENRRPSAEEERSRRRTVPQPTECRVTWQCPYLGSKHHLWPHAGMESIPGGLPERVLMGGFENQQQADLQDSLHPAASRSYTHGV